MHSLHQVLSDVFRGVDCFVCVCLCVCVCVCLSVRCQDGSAEGFRDFRSQEPMSSHSNAGHSPRRRRRSNWTVDSGGWSDSTSGNRRSHWPWGYSNQCGWYQKPWEVREQQYLNFADEYWQLESSGAWVRYRGGSKTGECWRRDSSGKWVLQLGDSNAEDGQAVSTYTKT